jgi:hypothetical protein
METGDHLKNGASLKSHTSRGNVLTLFCFAFFALFLGNDSVYAQTDYQAYIVVGEWGGSLTEAKKEVNSIGIDNLKIIRISSIAGTYYYVKGPYTSESNARQGLALVKKTVSTPYVKKVKRKDVTVFYEKVKKTSNSSNSNSKMIDDEMRLRIERLAKALKDAKK